MEKSDNVILLDVVTTLPIPVERVIEAISKTEWADILVMGHDPDGELMFFSSGADKAEMLWLIERIKFRMLDGTY